MAQRIIYASSIAATLLFFTWQAVMAEPLFEPSEPVVINTDLNFVATFDLNAGGNFGQSIGITNSQRVVFSVEVSGAEPISVTLEDPSDETLWSEAVQPGEKVWGSAVFMTGSQSINYANQGAGDSSFTVRVESVQPVPESFDGRSAPSGVNSVSAVSFSEGGFYTSTFDVNVGERYTVDMGSVFQQVVTESVSRIDYFPAGTEIFTVTHATTGGTVNWSADLTLESTSTSLPYALAESISSSTSKVLPLDDPTSVNIALSASGAGSDLAFEAKSESGAQISNGIINLPTGDTIWTTIDLPAGANELIFTPTGSIDYSIDVTAIPVGLATFDGNQAATSQDSLFRLTFPNSGVYQFDFVADAGRYQTVLTNTGTVIEQMRKTVETGNQSSRFFVPAGTHLFRINEDTATGADWDLTISLVQSGNTIFPLEDAGGQLEATGFGQDRFPIQVGVGVTANLNLTLTGATADQLSVNLLDSAGNLQREITPIFGSESTWAILPLASGTNYVELVADGGNGGNLSYEVVVDEAQTLISSGDQFQLAGSSLNNSFPPTATFSTAAPGLFEIDLGLASGEYQLQIDNDFFLKGIDASQTITTYLDSGEHNIQILTNGDTEWSVDLAQLDVAYDTLATARSGANLGGPASPSTEEWLPFRFDESSGTWVNLVITVTGDPGDQLGLEWLDTMTTTASNPDLYSAETAWIAAQIDADNRVHLTPDGGNTSPLEYDLIINPLADVGFSPATSWSGEALDTSQAHVLAFHAVYTGTYRVTTTLTSGTANVDIGSVGQSSSTLTQPTGEIELSSGTNLITVTGSAVAPTSSWTVEMVAIDILSPTISGLNPMTLTVGTTTTAQLNGANFLSPTVALKNGGSTYTLTVLSHAPTTASLQIPNTIPAGTYDIEIINEDGKADLYANGAVFVGPGINSVNPGSVREGYATNITINGSNLFSPTVFLKQGSTTIPLTTLSSSSSDIQARVPASLAVGLYDVQIQNGSITADFSNTLTEAFEVLPPLVPQVDNVSPASILINQGDFLTINGSNFFTPTAFLIKDGVTTTLNIFNSSETSITAVVPALLGAGAYDVRVQNGTPTADFSNLLTGGFEVLITANPTIGALSASVVPVGSSSNITITGSGFLSPTIILIDSDSNEIRLTTLSYTSSRIVAVVPDTLAVGSYDLLVENSNSNRSATLDDGLTVAAASVYLPLNGVEFANYPDLVVQAVVRMGNLLTVTIANSGPAPVQDEFWVDLYINPGQAPTGVNDTIDTLGSDGLVWLVDPSALPLSPGETLTLSYNDSFYQAEESRFSGTLPTDPAIYVQVDSANKASGIGGVVETHEVTGTVYNNIYLAE